MKALPYFTIILMEAITIALVVIVLLKASFLFEEVPPIVRTLTVAWFLFITTIYIDINVFNKLRDKFRDKE
jgi:hypothetical protein